MAGIYFHIPFCRRKCGYCDFYKSTEIAIKPQLIEALSKELEDRKNYLQGEEIETIFFGGGTPSVLSIPEIEKLLLKVYSLFKVEKDVEITFEANPDDLSPKYLSGLASTRINRLSIGIQSFLNEDLEKMGRRHNAYQAERCVMDAHDAGFKNISIDLIYGFPNQTSKRWENNLKKAFSLPANHLSSYHLTYHEGTPFYDLRKKNFIKEVTEEESVNQFELLIQIAEAKGFVQYEISNFAKQKAYSKHNSAYWFGKKYLGVGPSAHSYDIESRQWNIPDIRKYLKNIEGNTPYFEKELLDNDTKFNDYIITSMRTMWGVSNDVILNKFGKEYLDYFLKTINQYILSGHVLEKSGTHILTEQGLFVSDEIMATLMIIG